MDNSSLFAHNRAVVEGVSYSVIMNLDTLPADYPISKVITVSEVITLPITEFSNSKSYFEL